MSRLPTINDLTSDIQGGGGIAKAYNALSQQALDRTKKQLENQYYGPEKESEIGYRNSLKRGQDISNEFSPEKMGLSNELLRLNLEQLKKTNPLAYEQLRLKNENQQKINDLYNSILNNSSSGRAITPEPTQPNDIQNSPEMIQNTSSNRLNNNQLGNNNLNNIPNENNNQHFSNTTYAKAALASHLLGLGKPEIIDVNGRKLAVTPFGNIEVAQGLSPSEEAYQKGKGKYSAESYGANVDTYKSLSSQDVALDEMIHAIDNPEFYNVTGPVSSFFKNWSGTPEQKQLLGSLSSASGEIALQVAPSLKGAFTGRDQTLINTIKANPKTDFPDVFIGKLKAQKLINSVLKERNRLSAEYKDKGMSPLSAEEKAAKETPLDKYRPFIEKMIHHKLRIKSPNGRIATGTKDNIDKFLKDHPDWKVMQ